MFVKLILLILYILLINYSLKSKKNFKIKIMLIMLTIFFAGIFFLLIFYETPMLAQSEKLNINFYILLISFNMFFLVIFAIYLIKEIKSIKENITKISRVVSIKKYLKK